MKNIKTFEGFFDRFKSKKSEEDELIIDLTKKIDKGDARKMKIQYSTLPTSGGKYELIQSYKAKIDDQNITITQYSNKADLKGEPTDIPLHKIDSVLSKIQDGWSEEKQQELFDDGAVKASDYTFYKLEVDNNTVIGSWSYLEKLFYTMVSKYKRRFDN